MNTKQLNQKIVSNSNTILSTEINNELILLNTLTGDYISLDAIGTAIWKKLQKPIEFDALCQTLIEEFEVDKTVLQKDTFMFINDLIKNGLVELKYGRKS